MDKTNQQKLLRTLKSFQKAIKNSTTATERKEQSLKYREKLVPVENCLTASFDQLLETTIYYYITNFYDKDCFITNNSELIIKEINYKNDNYHAIDDYLNSYSNSTTVCYLKNAFDSYKVLFFGVIEFMCVCYNKFKNEDVKRLIVDFVLHKLLYNVQQCAYITTDDLFSNESMLEEIDDFEVIKIFKLGYFKKIDKLVTSYFIEYEKSDNTYIGKMEFVLKNLYKKYPKPLGLFMLKKLYDRTKLNGF